MVINIGCECVSEDSIQNSLTNSQLYASIEPGRTLHHLPVLAKGRESGRFTEQSAIKVSKEEGPVARSSPPLLVCAHALMVHAAVMPMTTRLDCLNGGQLVPSGGALVGLDHATRGVQLNPAAVVVEQPLAL